MRRRSLRAAAAVILAAASLAALSFVAGATPGADTSAAATAFSARAETAWDWPQVAQIVANLRASHPTAPLVVLLGGSSARECTFRDQDWTAQIECRGGIAVEAHNLGSKHRTFAQDLEIVKLLPRDVDTIVYIGINLGRFCNPRSYPTITLPEANLDYVPKQRNIYYSTRIQSAATKREHVRRWMLERWPHFRVNYAYNIDVLRRIIEACRRRGLRPVLLDLPRDIPIIGRSFDVPVGMYRSGCERLARRYHIPFLHFVGGIGLTNRDYFDIFHTVETGRVKYQRMLSDKTIKLLERYGMTPAASPAPSASPSATASSSPAT